MKLFFRTTFNIFYILTILIGCATAEETKRTDQHTLLNQGIALAKEGEHDRHRPGGCVWLQRSI
jgi:hypothetical protein